jgi:hypothetical protein
MGRAMVRIMSRVMVVVMVSSGPKFMSMAMFRMAMASMRVRVS